MVANATETSRPPGPARAPGADLPACCRRAAARALHASPPRGTRPGPGPCSRPQRGRASAGWSGGAIPAGVPGRSPMWGAGAGRGVAMSGRGLRTLRRRRGPSARGTAELWVQGRSPVWGAGAGAGDGGTAALGGARRSPGWGAGAEPCLACARRSSNASGAGGGASRCRGCGGVVLQGAGVWPRVGCGRGIQRCWGAVERSVVVLGMRGRSFARRARGVQRRWAWGGASRCTGMWG